MVLAAPRHVGSSRARARTRALCIGRQIRNHWVTRDIPGTSNIRSPESEVKTQHEFHDVVTKHSIRRQVVKGPGQKSSSVSLHTGHIRPFLLLTGQTTSAIVNLPPCIVLSLSLKELRNQGNY